MMAWQLKREAVVRRMTTSKDFADYPGSESGDVYEENPGNYGGRKPFSPIVEEDEDHLEEFTRKHKEGVIGGGTTTHRMTSSPKSSTSPKHQPLALSPSSHSSGSGHSSPRSPPSYPPPPPTFQPPPLPTRTHVHHPGMGNSGSKVQKSGTVPQRSIDKKPYGMQYTNHQSDPQYSGRGGVSKSNTHYSHHSSHNYQNQNETRSHSEKPGPQSMSGSRTNHTTEVVVNSKVVPSKQYPMSITDQSALEGMSEVLPLKPDQILIGVDPGIRESPSGASSPSSTPSNTLVKSSQGHAHYDPFTVSDSDTKLLMGGLAGGISRYRPTQPQDSGEIEAHGDMNYHTHYPNEIVTGGCVSASRVHIGQESSLAKNTQKAGSKVQGGLGVKDSIREWENWGAMRNNVEPLDSTGGGAMEGMVPRKVLHPSNSSPSSRGEKGEHDAKSDGPTSTNRIEGSGTKPSVSPDNVGSVRPSSSDSGYVPSSSSAHSLSPPQNSHTPSSVDNSSSNPDHTHLGGLSPGSSTEELMQINEVLISEQDVNSTDGTTSSHQILKPEPTKSGSKVVGQIGSNYLAPSGGTYSNKPSVTQGSSSYHVTSSAESQPPPPPGGQSTYPSLSQPTGSTSSQITTHPPNQLSLSQGHTYYIHSNSRGEVLPPGATYGGRQNISYENVPMVYDNLQANTRHAHMPHTHSSQGPPPSKYGGGPQQGQHQQYPRERSHDPHNMVTSHGRAHEYPVTRPSSYGVGMMGSRRKPINPASISVAHDAAASGDIATLHHMLSNKEIDAFTFNDHKFTLAHQAALHGQQGVLIFLVNDVDLPLTALNLPDDSYSTPAMLAIQGGHVECLQWMVDECKVPFEVRDTGGETLMHHAAYNGQVKCLEWLLKAIKKKEDQHKEILDESGVTPSHFAAQGGHLDCLQLLIDHGYSVVHADQEGQKPLDWADAMNQTVCVRYLMMYEACWALSAEVTHLSEKLVILHKEYDKAREALKLQNQDHQHAMELLQQSHEERITKMREQYVDFTAHLLKNSSSTGSSGGGGGTSTNTTSSNTSNKNKSQSSIRKVQTDPLHRRSNKPPIPPESAKKHLVRGSQNHESKQDQDAPDLDYRTVTPQEVMEKQLSSVAHRMTLSREARKRQGQGALVPRNYSPLTPIMQRLYSQSDEDQSRTERSGRSQRHSESHERRTVTKAVKFSNTVTEFPDYSRFDDDNRTVVPKITGQHNKYSTGHTAAVNHSSPAHSVPGHSNLGQHSDRSMPDGESGHGKNDISRKSSGDK